MFYGFSSTQGLFKIKDTLSNAQPLDFGVPQGLVLGHILFTKYTAPLGKLIQGFTSISHHLYADEPQIYTSPTSGNASTHLQMLQECISSIQGWIAENKLRFNTEKNKNFS